MIIPFTEGETEAQSGKLNCWVPPGWDRCKGRRPGTRAELGPCVCGVRGRGAGVLSAFAYIQTDLPAGLSHDSGFATEHRPSHPWMRISLSVPSLLLLLGAWQ